MRNILKYVVTGIILLSLNGCDYLDYNETSGQSREEAYSYFGNISGMVSYVYTLLPKDLGAISGAMMESATDNSVFTWESNKITTLTNGSWSSLNLVDDGWKYWEGIRGANSFLENFDPEVLKRFEYSAEYDEMIEKSAVFPYEVRLLRAFYFFELAKRYGDIPLLTRTYLQEEINSVEKTPFNEVIDFIAKECTEVAPKLPVSQADFWGDTGRVTQGLALALKSRALLYAASPLFNSNNEPEKWAKAAKAAYEVIGMNVYQLPKITEDPLYSTTGGNGVLKSKQLIFERRNAAKESSFEAQNEPMGYEGAKGGNTPTQNLVDAYEMKDGVPFDWSNPSHIENMYYAVDGTPTRDPRLYLNALTNGSSWLTATVETFEGGKNQILAGSTKTGYYLRKYMNPSVSLDPVKPNKLEHHYILFRYAEILLNYAEAMNEWKGPDAIAEGCPLTARQALNQVRDCADMKHIEETGEAFTQKTRNERRIELAFEGHRFYDIRRWKIADNEDVKNIYGVKITKNGDAFSYEKKLVEKRVWDDKMYLFPYPQNEVYMNDKLGQNPGW